MVTGAEPASSGASSANAEKHARCTPTSNPYEATVAMPKINPRRARSFIALDHNQSYFAAVNGGAGSSGNRLGSPRAPRTSSSSNTSDGATTDAGKPFCAEPNAPTDVPAQPLLWLC